MKVNVQCLYCGKEEELVVYSTEFLKNQRCDKCGDKKKKIREIETKNVYGYPDEELPPTDDSFLTNRHD